MNNISLTSSMRSNLQSLQGIAGKQDVVQNRLASGLKVSSAIDNASSYYTAMSLNNRSADLSTLLDSMSQGIQTIRTASQTLTTAAKMLEQAKALATQTLDKTPPPVKTAITKSWLIENGVRAEDIVTSKAELTARMARATVGDRIVVWGKIEMGDESLTMKNNVKLVGANYVINEAGKSDDFMVDESQKGKITFNKTTYATGINAANNTEISDLSLELTTLSAGNYQGLIYSNNNIVTMRNLIFKQMSSSGGNNISAIYSQGSLAKINLEGNIDINTSGNRNHGIYSVNGATINQKANSELNITTSGQDGYGIMGGISNLAGTVNITTSGKNGYGIYGVTSNLSGNINMTLSGGASYGFAHGNHTFKSTAKILIEYKTSENRIFYADATKASYSWERGAQIGLKNSTATTDALWEAQSAGSIVDKTTSTTDLAAAPFGWTKTGKFPGIQSAKILRVAQNDTKGVRDDRSENHDVILSVAEGFQQYSSLLSQFNNLITDSGYKGINLLLEQNLRINFNEDRSSNVNIKGVDASAKGLALDTINWNSRQDIEESLSELDAGISKLRGFSEEFGNYYSIVSTREDFTKSIINVLTEGADKLTLADMNQESANMLALQTRQQLAVNSLSLASQASQSVLKLF